MNATFNGVFRLVFLVGIVHSQQMAAPKLIVR